MSKLESLYIRLGEPAGEMRSCCETAEWAAGEIERLHAALRHVVRIYMVSEVAYNPSTEVDRMVQWLLSSAKSKPPAECGPSEANARLISAAPELLAALQALVGWEDAEIKHFGATGPDDWIMEGARAAIAKATA